MLSSSQAGIREEGPLHSPIRGATPRAWLSEDAEGLALIMAKELADLRAAGMKPTAGDIRCIALGHITRMAIRQIRSSWDATLPAEKSKRPRITGESQGPIREIGAHHRFQFNGLRLDTDTAASRVAEGEAVYGGDRRKRSLIAEAAAIQPSSISCGMRALVLNDRSLTVAGPTGAEVARLLAAAPSAAGDDTPDKKRRRHRALAPRCDRRRRDHESLRSMADKSAVRVARCNHRCYRSSTVCLHTLRNRPTMWPEAWELKSSRSSWTD